MKGNPVFRLPEGMPRHSVVHNILDLTDDGRRVGLHELTDGMRLLILGVMGWVDARVIPHEKDGCAAADDGGSIWFLDYCQERCCWICYGGINKKALGRMSDEQRD